MRLQPIVSNAHIYGKGHTQRKSVFHFVAHHFGERLHLRFRHIKNKFIVYLQQQAALPLLAYLGPGLPGPGPCAYILYLNEYL